MNGIQKRAFGAAVAILAASCGSDLLKKDGADSKDKAAADSGNVEFSGYVQKAFAIKVNGAQFQDSEDFYTHFIDKLVKPAYPDLQSDDVTVNGAYGLDEFGTNAGVYMAAMASSGHLFQAVTDAQSMFTIDVQPSAQDETYQAKVIIRIGLDIKRKDTTDSYCYLLFGLKQTLVGFGATNTSNPDAPGQTIFGKKFAVQTEVDTPVQGTLAIGGNGKDTCDGDSGGPVFGQIQDGSWRMFAVTSRDLNPDVDCGSGGAYGRLIDGLCWIQSDSGISIPGADSLCAIAGGGLR